MICACRADLVGFVRWASGLLEMGPVPTKFSAADFLTLTTFLSTW